MVERICFKNSENIWKEALKPLKNKSTKCQEKLQKSTKEAKRNMHQRKITILLNYLIELGGYQLLFHLGFWLGD